MAEDVDNKSGDMPEAGEIPAIRIEKGRVSYNGLLATSGQIEEECNFDLIWPQCMDTYKAMLKDSTVSSTLNQTEMQISKVKWNVSIPEGFEDELKDKARFLYSIMEDMEHSWVDFIRRCSSFNRFGFAPIEKVYRKRTKANGSRFEDGLYGIRELPLIAQDSVSGWEWDDTGRKLTGLHQYKIIPTGKDSKIYKYSDEDKFIRREKFMLFRADPIKDSPIGTSPLNNVYMAWRYKTEYERQEAVGVSGDVRGLKVISLPPQYMSETATDEEKQVYKSFQEVLSLIHSGEQSGVILPSVFDENGKPLFDFKVMSVLGQATHNISEIIQRYRREIVSGLMAPHMILGQDGSGSFALAESLETIAATVVEARLVEIRDVLNHDLIPQLFKINGWKIGVLPKFEFENPKRASLDDLGKYLQRIAAAGMLSNDFETANWVAEQAGMPKPFEGEETTVEQVRAQMTSFTSNAGEGMETLGEGTSKGISPTDHSTANKENS